ncbi:MAG: DUF4258 domain-containing protein [Moorella humiferrea]|nr:DUF4258 domain-containing protein [Moorella humiferrea]
MDIVAIRKAVFEGRWAMTAHARERAGRRKIKDGDVAKILAHGEILEDYPNDPRGPSALVLGYTESGRPFHAVCAFDPSGTLLIITVYEPEPPKWENARTRRQQ